MAPPCLPGRTLYCVYIHPPSLFGGFCNISESNSPVYKNSHTELPWLPRQGRKAWQKRLGILFSPLTKHGLFSWRHLTFTEVSLRTQPCVRFLRESLPFRWEKHLMMRILDPLVSISDEKRKLREPKWLSHLPGSAAACSKPRRLSHSSSLSPSCCPSWQSPPSPTTALTRSTPVPFPSRPWSPRLAIRVDNMTQHTSPLLSFPAPFVYISNGTALTLFKGRRRGSDVE